MFPEKATQERKRLAEIRFSLVIDKVIELRKQGLGVASIATRLTKANIVNPQTGNPYSIGTIRNILLRAKEKGMYVE